MQTTGREKIRVLILPKFEVGEMSGDFPGEAQFYYEKYCAGGKSYEIKGSWQQNRLYVNQGIALIVTGPGKVNAAISLAAVLSDCRFDFSRASILSTGCAGSVPGRTVMGDVIIATSIIDYDLGHHMDIRELESEDAETWFFDESFKEQAFKRLNREFIKRIYEKVKRCKLETTEETVKYQLKAFSEAVSELRNPGVIKGTFVTGDNYWKGKLGCRKADYMAQVYGSEDCVLVSEMEDMALLSTAERFGLADRFCAIRVAVNYTEFLNGDTPERLWTKDYKTMDIASEHNQETVNIFPVAMKNCFRVGEIIIDALKAEAIWEK